MLTQHSRRGAARAEAGKAGLTTLETVVGVYPIVDEWSTANGCLTATQKLVPKGVQKHQAKELDIIKKRALALQEECENRQAKRAIT